jgi:hypothetical protein
MLERTSERPRELVAAGDIELAVDAVEVGLGGAGRDEQRLRNLAIGEAFGSQPRDPQFGGRQRVAAGDCIAPWLGARGDQLGTRAGGDSPRAAAVCEIQRPLQLRARLGARPSAPQRGTVVGEGAGELEG